MIAKANRRKGREVGEWGGVRIRDLAVRGREEVLDHRSPPSPPLGMPRP